MGQGKIEIEMSQTSFSHNFTDTYMILTILDPSEKSFRRCAKCSEVISML